MDYDTGFEDTFVDTGVGRMHYRHHKGSSDTIIMIHGFAANARTWKRFVNYLPDELNLYLVDLLGHGTSDAPVLEYNITLQLNAIDALVKKEKIENPYLFGHSYGGWAAVLYALRKSARGIIIEDSAGLFEFRMERQLADPNYKEQMLRSGLLLNPRKSVILSMLESQHKGEILTKDMLSGLNVPTLIIWGEKDDTVDIKYGRLFADYIKGSTFEVIPGAAHAPHYSNPEETSKKLLDFLNAHKN